MRVFRAQLGLICVWQIQVWPYLSVDEQCEFLDRMDFEAIFQQINLHINEQYEFIHQAPVVQTMDSAIHRINRYPLDKY